MGRVMAGAADPSASCIWKKKPSCTSTALRAGQQAVQGGSRGETGQQLTACPGCSLPGVGRRHLLQRRHDSPSCAPDCQDAGRCEHGAALPPQQRQVS